MLTKRYKGALIRSAVGSGQFSPLSLTSVFAWYDASQDVVVADDTIVTGWTDRSGNGRDMIDGTAVNANFQGPRYKTNVFGVLPALKGWGSNGSARSFLRRNTTFPDSASVYLVVRTATGAIQNGIMGTSLSGDDPSFTGPYFLIQDASGTWRTLDNVTFRNVQAMANNTKYIIRILWDRVTDTQKIYVNGTLVLDSIIADSGARAWYELFSGFQQTYQGHIAECAIQSAISTGSEQSDMETYLNTKWGVY